MREKEKVKKMKKVEEEDEEEEQEQRKEKSTLFFIFSPLSSCFSFIYSISIHCFFYAACHLQGRKKTFFFSFDVGRRLVQLNLDLSMKLYVFSFFII